MLRYGNYVIAYVTGGNNKSTIGEWAQLNETVPAGFRPKYSGVIIGNIPGAVATTFVQTIDSGGKMTQIVNGDAGSSNDYRGIGIWYCDDAWPS